MTISTNYNTVNVLRTMEDLLGIDHLNQSDANAAPMSDVFTHDANLTPYTALIPGSLCAAPVDPKTGRPAHPIRRERDTTGDGTVDQWWTWEGSKVSIASDRNGDGKVSPAEFLIIVNWLFQLASSQTELALGDVEHNAPAVVHVPVQKDPADTTPGTRR